MLASFVPVGLFLMAGTADNLTVASRAEMGAAQDSNPIVVLETSLGEITVELLPEKAPNTVENFLTLVRSGFYDEMLFHRVVRDFAIQTGLLGMDGQVKPHEVQPLENEAGTRSKNLRGAIAMARGEDPHSATTQFFINVLNNEGLDFTAFNRRGWGYAVFGHVIDGMSVVDEIARMDTKRLGPFRNFPADPVALYSAYER